MFANEVRPDFVFSVLQPVKDRDDVDAFVVVYSVTDRSSFSYAQACLQDICGKGKICRRAVILVANKQESVRNRVVSEDGEQDLYCSPDVV